MSDSRYSSAFPPCRALLHAEFSGKHCPGARNLLDHHLLLDSVGVARHFSGYCGMLLVDHCRFLVRQSAAGNSREPNA
jgi:hypothetical protein